MVIHLCQKEDEYLRDKPYFYPAMQHAILEFVTHASTLLLKPPKAEFFHKLEENRDVVDEWPSGFI